MKQQDQKITYFLYARKSSESEDRQVQSIDDQINRLKELANTLGISIKEILTEAKSAKKPNCRPVFAEMLKRIENGEAQGILCWQINRLSRNPIDSGTISWMLQQGILQCIQTIDRRYLPDDNVLLFNVESGMANQFIIDLRKNSRRGMVGKAERGWLPSRAPVGYLNDKLEHTIYKDPERFHLVRKMWDMMLTGNYTPSKILAIANNEWGFRTPKWSKLGNKEMSLSEMYRIFSNIFYTGLFVWSGTTYQGNHEAMITLEEYDRVQILLGRKGRPRPKAHDFAYTGIIVCSVCGGMITATEKIKIVKKTMELKAYVYYHCGHQKKNAVCTQKIRIPLKEVEEMIDIELERYTILPQFLKWALEILNRDNDKEIEERTKIYETQHQTLVATQRELDNLTKMRYRELIDDETFIKERDGLKAKILKLQQNLHETENRASKWLELTEKTFYFACYARKEFLTGSLERKRELFSALGQNFWLKNGKVVIIPNEWFVPIEKAYPALEMEFKRLELAKNLTNTERNEAFAQLILSWGAQRDSNP
ncbi:MAG: recombinase family protein [Patescibacteria group bacterium]|nr:recombinase family protein [Patescibacteria group bacterium]MDE2438190.1 recombinase family protein [Patescibacteria group bacterium]